MSQGPGDGNSLLLAQIALQARERLRTDIDMQRLFSALTVRQQVESVLATMPGKDELRATLLATLQAPAQNLVMLLNAPGQNLAYLLDARKRQQEEAG